MMTAHQWRWIVVKVLMLMLLLIQGCEQPSFAYTKMDMVKAIIGEAEGEPQEGKEAVACAINNRFTLSGVYGLKAPRVLKHLYSHTTWDNAVVALWMAEDQHYCAGLIHGAQYWEGTAFPIPYWAKTMTLTAVIGNQRFFRKD